MKALSVIFLALVLMLGACKKADPPPKGDFLILGRLSGYCYLPCAHFFLVQNGSVRYSGAVRDWDPGLTFPQYAAAGSYALVQHLEEHLPAPLFALNQSIYGQPNSHDQGSYYLHLNHGNQSYEWILDPDIRDSSGHFLQPLTRELDSVLNLLIP